MYTCSLCLPNPANAKQRKCQEPGFDNLKKPRKMDDFSLEYSFCPGKATWYSEIIGMFEKCRVTFETGLLPREGSFEEQDEMFTDVFYAFVERWSSRRYNRIWMDVREYTKVVLESVFGKKGK